MRKSNLFRLVPNQTPIEAVELIDKQFWASNHNAPKRIPKYLLRLKKQTSRRLSRTVRISS